MTTPVTDLREGDTPPAEDTPIVNAPETVEEFERKVTHLCSMMQNDPLVRDRVLAETYVNIASMEKAIRGIFEMLQSEGVSGMLKGMMGRKRGKD